MCNPLLSVIVPIYKAEAYLDRCINSIIHQTLSDLELILIDDGSPDNCGEICDNYSQNDNRIKVIHKSNGGISAARNAGLEIATGRYITFVDSDDYLGDLSTYKENIDILLCNSDIEVLQYPTYLIKENRCSLLYGLNNDCDLKEDDVFKEWYRGVDIINYCVWNKIYKKETIAQLRFPETEIFEDIHFNKNLMGGVKKVHISTKGAYHYNFNTSSITQTFNSAKMIMAALIVRMDIYEQSFNYPDLSQHRIGFLLDNLKFYLNLHGQRKGVCFSKISKQITVGFPSIANIFNVSGKGRLNLLMIKLLGLSCFTFLCDILFLLKK